MRIDNPTITPNTITGLNEILLVNYGHSLALGTVVSGIWNGRVISHTYMENERFASATESGLVSTSAQTFAGAKTFINTVSLGSEELTDGEIIFYSAGGPAPVKLKISGGDGYSPVWNLPWIDSNGPFNVAAIDAGQTFTNAIWHGTPVGVAYGGTGFTTVASGSVLVANSLNTLTALASTSGTKVLQNVNGVISWATGGAGITSLNGLTGLSQTFVTGTTGSTFNIVSSGTAHTFNIPNASTTASGIVTTGTQKFEGSKGFHSATTAVLALLSDVAEFDIGAGAPSIEYDGVSFNIKSNEDYDIRIFGFGGSSAVYIVNNEVDFYTSSVARGRVGSNGFESFYNIGIGTSIYGTSADKVLAFFNGTAPATRPADTIQLWSADNAEGDARLYILTESGVTPVSIGNGIVTASLSGNASTATRASTVTVADSTSATCYVGLFEAATGSLAAKTDGGLTYAATTGILTATGGFVGSLTGGADAASTLTLRPTSHVSASTGADIIFQVGSVGSPVQAARVFLDNEVLIGAGTTKSAKLHVLQAAGTGTKNPSFKVTAPAHTSLTAATEHTQVLFDFSSTMTWAAGGTLAAQRYMKVLAPTMAFAGSAVTQAATVYIEGAPKPGAGISGYTTPCTLWIDGVAVNSVGITPTNSYGLYISPNTGASSRNYAIYATGDTHTTTNASVGGTLNVTGHVTVEGVTSTGATGTGKFVFDSAPTISGHPTIEGVTATGATGTGKFVFDGTPTLITPVIGAATGTSLAVTGLITSSGGGIGYATGAGSSVNQGGTDKTTGVTLNKYCGTIVTSTGNIAAAGEVSFTVANSVVAATDLIVVNHVSGGTAGVYGVWANAVGAGTFNITISNLSTAGKNEQPVIGFAVIKGVVA